MNYINKLIALANKLDYNGFNKEADLIDRLIKTSMPLLHDDSSKPRLVYRIQNAAGEGPYKDEDVLSDEEHEAGAQPSPYHADYPGQDFTDKELDSLFDKKEPLLFGFESANDVLLWFGQEKLKNLYRDGFKVYEMYAKKIYLSHTKRQVMFIKDDGRAQREVSLEEILKTHGQQSEKSFLKPKTYDDVIVKRLDHLKIRFDKIMKSLETEQSDDLDNELINVVNRSIDLAKHLDSAPRWINEAIKMLGILSPLLD